MKNDVYVIIPRPHAMASILIFEDGSEEFSAFIDGLIAEGRGFMIGDDVSRCLGPAKPKRKAKAKAKGKRK